MKNQTARHGFTLVELATVMLIVGVVTAGVLKGQQLIAQSRIKTTIAQVHSYQAAMQSFADAYKQLPGDMARAPSLIVGCEAASGCVQGNSNGRVGLSITDIFSDDQSRLEAEPSQFWRHLAVAGFINDIGKNPQIKAWGHSHPASAFNGGFQVVYFDRKSAYGTAYINNHLILLRSGIQGPLLQGAGKEAIPPIYAEILDRKIDDGLANRGSVKSVGVNCDEHYSRADLRNGIYQKTSSANCAMIFQADRAG